MTKQLGLRRLKVVEQARYRLAIALVILIGFQQLIVMISLETSILSFTDRELGQAFKAATIVPNNFSSHAHAAFD